MKLSCSGYLLPSSTFNFSLIPNGWLSFLRGQTLPQAPGEADDAMYLITYNLPEIPPSGLRETFLETMAWGLLTRPDSQAIFVPLYTNISASKPVTILKCHPGQFSNILSSGYLALVRYSAFQRLCNAPCFSVALKKSLRKGNGIVVRSHALFSSSARSRRNLRDIPFQLFDLIIRRIKAALTVDQKTMLKSKLRRCRNWIDGLRRGVSSKHLPLATMKQWPSALSRAEIATIPFKSENRIPILMALHWLELGGAEKYAVDLIKFLSKQKYVIYCTTDITSNNSWAKEIEPFIAGFFHLPEFSSETSSELFYDHLIRSRGIRLMHLHHAPKAYAALFFLRRFHPDLRILDTLHILELPPHSGGYPESTCRDYEPFINMHHVVSRQLRSFIMQRWQVPEDKVLLSYLNVDVQYFDPDRVVGGALRNRYGISESTCLIGFIGRMVRQKQPIIFVEMASILLQRWHDMGYSNELGFVMIGNGPLMVDIQAAVEKAGLSEVLRIHGETGDMRPLYKDLNLLVMPSENEGLALVTYEAMAMGLPVVFTDVGAQSELLPPELLVPNVSPLAERLADASWPFIIDPVKRAATGNALRQHILSHHRADQSFREMEALYNRLLMN